MAQQMEKIDVPLYRQSLEKNYGYTRASDFVVIDITSDITKSMALEILRL